MVDPLATYSGIRSLLSKGAGIILNSIYCRQIWKIGLYLFYLHT